MPQRFTPDHEGLQSVAVHRAQWPDHSGMTFNPHSDKEIMVAVDERSISPDQLEDGLPSYEQPGSPRSETSGPRRYCGLPRRMFIIVIVLIICIVFGAGIGGGIGGALASRQRQSAESSDANVSVVTYTSANHVFTTTVTHAATATASSPTSTATSGTGAYKCPSQNNTTYTSPVDSSGNTTYTILCDLDQPNGVDGVVGGPVTDMNTGVVVTSIEACIDACVGYSTWSDPLRCEAVTYTANITAALELYGRTGNCLFKNQRAAPGNWAIADGVGEMVVSAFLDDDV